jgi:hypothetical protein
MKQVQRIIPPLSFIAYESADKIRDKLPDTFRKIGAKAFGFNIDNDEYWIKTKTIHAFIYIKNYGFKYTEVQINFYSGTNLDVQQLITNINTQLCN